MYAGQVPWCFPYWDGSISVSYALRVPATVYIAKPVLGLIGLAVMIYWSGLVISSGWHQRMTGRVILGLGCAGILFLWVYLYALGVDGGDYRQLRRIGTYGHIAGSALAQIMATVLLWRERSSQARGLLLLLWGLIAWMLFITIVGIPGLASYTSLSQARRTVEWHYFLAMYSWFMVGSFAFRRSRERQDSLLIT